MIGVTGADGFVGRHVLEALAVRGLDARPLVRDAECAARLAALRPHAPAAAVTGDLGPETAWSPHLDGLTVVIHLAARVHVMDETAADPLAAFRLVNTAGTERLAREAARAGVARLVYVSTVKVNGEATDGRAPFRGGDAPAPEDPYGVSKWEAEQALAAVAAETGLEVTVLRPPLVHGAGVGGNLLRLLKLVERGLPLPLASVNNRRSLIAVRNLADVLALAASHPAAAGRTYTVADAEAVSTAELIRILARGLGRPARLLPAPIGLLRGAARALGKGAAVERLAGSLEVDASQVMRELAWSPPVSAEEGLLEMAAWYRTLR